MGGNGKFAGATLFVAGAGAQFEGPVRPCQRTVFFFWRLGHHLKLRDALRTMAVGSTDTIAAGIAAANHDDVFAVSAQLVFELVASVHFVLLWQEFHGEVNA